jgi:formylglycine-generating enzyme required for sulfatase activity
VNYSCFIRRSFSVVLLVLSLFASSFRLEAQNPPTLSLSFQTTTRTAQINISADAGSPLAIEYTTNLSGNPIWLSLTNFTIYGSPVLVVAPSGLQTNAFYRALITVPTSMGWIPNGTFVMGSPVTEAGRGPNNETQHTVTLTNGFFMSTFLVTQSAYLSLVHTNPSYFNTNNAFTLDLNRPVEQVTWADATNYCHLLTVQERAAGRIFPNWLYRLPTEAEWEYACRAGATTQFYLGTNLLSGMANFDGRYEYHGTGTVFNASGTVLNRTVAVGGYSANSFGLYDMAGNVWEWVNDWYDVYAATSVTNPIGPATGTQRVFRGGALNATGALCRSANRNKVDPATAVNTIGFRVVLGAP